MFGRGKSSEKPASTKAKKRASSSFPWKAWLLNNIEKIAMGLFVAFTGYLVYDGLTAGKYDSSKSPEDLSVQARTAKSEMETKDHWNDIKLEPERAMPNDFVKLVDGARRDMDPTLYIVDNIPEKVSGVSGEKRGDPEFFAPIEVQGNSYFGTIAVFSPKPAKADELLNAPPVGDGKRPRKPPTPATPARTLIPTFDVGFQPKAGTPPPAAPAVSGRSGRVVENKVVPKLTHFNVVTAAVPHQMIADSYKKVFASAADYRPDRDSPQYLGYEVQRVDVTDNPERTIDEAEWKEATSCMLEAQLKEKQSWVGTCEEVAVAKYVVDHVLTMPIPPILISDYRPLASHPLVPRLDLVRKTTSGGDDGQPMDDSSPPEDTTSGNDESSGGMVVPNVAAIEDAKYAPKMLEATDYKLLRFVDFAVNLNRVYRYRVRLALEDPNYPRAKSLAPRTSDLKTQVGDRVQVLEAADADAIAKLAPGKKHERSSKQYTPWSKESSPVVTHKPVELYSSKAVGSWTVMKTPNGKSEVSVETMPLKAAIVYAEWSPDLSLLVPHKKNEVERGTVLSGIAYVGSTSNPEPGLDAIHPVSKVIKWVKDFKFSNPVTIADIRGGQPLAAEKRGKDKDPLPSGGEVVAYDPLTGELVISREFESTLPYQMLGFTHERPSEEGK